MAPVPRFTRIYLDSEPLTASGWPRVSVSLNSLLSAATTDPVPYPLYLPVAVEREQEAQFLRDYSNAAAALSKAPRVINGLISRLAEPALQSATASPLAAVRQQYRARVQAVKDEWHIQPVPMSGRTVEDLFGLLLDRQKPFDGDGGGLGDALIYLSVVDHLHQTPHEIGLLVSGDRDYEGAEPLAAAAGVELVTLSLNATVQAIRARLGAAILRVIDRLEEAARQAVESDLATLIVFVTANLDIPAYGFTSFGETLVGVNDISDLTVAHVRTSPAVPDIGQQVRLSAELRARLGLTVEVAAYPPAPPMRVGQTHADYQSQIERGLLIALMSGETVGPKRAVQEKSVNVTIEAEATAVRSDAGYMNLTWTAARLARPLPPSLQGLHNLDT